MKHDSQCELGRLAFPGAPKPSEVCNCAERAYARDPLPEEDLPIYDDPYNPLPVDRWYD